MDDEVNQANITIMYRFPICNLFCLALTTENECIQALAERNMIGRLREKDAKMVRERKELNGVAAATTAAVDRDAR